MCFRDVINMTVRMVMLRRVLTEMESDINESVERTGRDWMVLLLSLSGDPTARMIETVKCYWRK